MRAGRDDVVQADLVFNDNQRANLAPGHMFQREDHFVDDQLGIAFLRNPARSVEDAVVAQLFQNAPDFGLKQHNQQHRPGVDHPREQA